MVDILKQLQNWYASICNDDWEHTYGIKIENIDNPGWMLTIDLEDTWYANEEFEEIKTQRKEENDWLICKKENLKFKAFGGPHNLEEIIEIFLKWAEEIDNIKAT